MKKIVIDARLAGLEHAGFGRYTEMLIQHFGKFSIFNFQFSNKNCESKNQTLYFGGTISDAGHFRERKSGHGAFSSL